MNSMSDPEARIPVDLDNVVRLERGNVHEISTYSEQGYTIYVVPDDLEWNVTTTIRTQARTLRLEAVVEKP